MGAALWMIMGSRGQKRVLFLLPLVLWISLQTFHLHILPMITRSGRVIVNPWVWFQWVQILILWSLFRDMRSLRREDFKPVWITAGLIGVALSVLMILQALNMDPVLLIGTELFGPIRWLHDNHVVGLMGNSFQAAGCLAVLVPVATSLGWWWAVIPMIGALVLASSTTSLIAGLVGLLSVLWLNGCRRLVAALFCAGLFLSWRSCFYGSSLLADRLTIWAQTFRVWSERFFLEGAGIGTFKLMGIQGPSIATEAPNAVRWAHNEWMQIGAEIGLVGLLLLLIPLSHILLKSARSDNRSTCAFGVLISGLILSLTHIPLHMAPTALILLIALSATIVHLEESPIAN